MNITPFYKSKTVWFNILMTLIGVITAFQGMPTLQAWAPLFADILAVGNIILRVWFTTTPIQ